MRLFISMIFPILFCCACQEEPATEAEYYDDKTEYTATSDFYKNPELPGHPASLKKNNPEIGKSWSNIPGTKSGKADTINPAEFQQAGKSTANTADQSIPDSQPEMNTTAKKPNIVIIMADDLDDIFTTGYFSEVLPVIDSLKQTGFTFVNSFTPMSICCPSRAASLSGKYAHNNGVYRNVSMNGGWEYFRKNEPYTLPAHLSKSGYRTTLLGKYLNGYSIDEAEGELIPPYGWTDGAVFVNFFFYAGYDYDLMHWDDGVPVNDTVWKADSRKVVHHDNKPQDYSTDVLTREAVTFIDKTEKKDDQPFFIFLCPTAPHWPLQPAPRHLEKTNEKWINAPIPEKPNFNNDHGALATSAEKEIPLDKSSWLQETWEKRVRQMHKGVWYYNQTFSGSVPKPIKSFIDADWYSRMGSLYALNDMVREVIRVLKENGEWDNTLLIFTSDNGYSMGAHAMIHKGNPYEEAVRVPLVIAGGDSLHLKTPGQVQEWVTNLDLMPTILNMAGIEMPEDLDGLSLVPLLISDSTQPLRDKFVMEYIGPGMSVQQFAYRPKFIMKHVPLYILDHPTYNAIRMKIKTGDQGAAEEKTYKYIEWQKYPERKVLKFYDKFRAKDPEVLAGLAAGKKKLRKLKARAEEVETELYDLDEDPYEMDNLLYYKPAQYHQLALELKSAMRAIILENEK